MKISTIGAAITCFTLTNGSLHAQEEPPITKEGLVESLGNLEEKLFFTEEELAESLEKAIQEQQTEVNKIIEKPSVLLKLEQRIDKNALVFLDQVFAALQYIDPHTGETQ